MARSLKNLYKYYSTLKDRYYHKLKKEGGVIKQIQKHGNFAKLIIHPIGVKPKNRRLPTQWERLGWSAPYEFVFYLPANKVQNVKTGEIIPPETLDVWFDLQI